MIRKLLLILLLASNAFSQYKIEYDYVNESTDSYGTSKTISKCYLYTDNTQSKFVKDRVINGELEQELYYPKADLEERFRKEAKQNVFGDSIGNVVTKFLKVDSLVVRQADGTLLTENFKKVDYTIHDQFKSINNYKCQKASCKIYEREFEVWFTTDIPVNDGPWKFYGLPGLIMEVHSKNRFHNFYFTSIKKTNNAGYIYALTPFNEVSTRIIFEKKCYNELETHFKYRKSKNPDGNIKMSLENLDTPLIVFE